MEIILHVGMGKTGTTSIQKVLAANATKLRSQGIEYLGMWFSFIDEAMQGYIGQQQFYQSQPEEMASYAKSLLDRLERV